MKVIIACLNSKYIHASLSPWCLLAGVRELGKRVLDAKVMESTINGDICDFAEKIIAQKPDVVGFSAYIWNVTKTLEVCKILSRHNIKTVLGGPEVSYRPKDVLNRYPFVDYVLTGEGEHSFPKLLDTLSEGGDLKKVPGLSFKSGGEVVTVAEEPLGTDPPSPYCEEYFENLKGRISYIETSRGCPFRCAFCLSGRCGGLRFFNITKVKENIINLANSGTKTVKFVDRTFNANPKRANEILCFILENYGEKIPTGVCFHFEIAGDILAKDTLDILKQMPVGAVQLEIGMQSFCEKTLQEINRKTNIKKLTKNIKTLVSFGNMHIHIDLIAGLPFEDLKTFRESFNIGYSLKANMLQMGFLKLLYGADMRENPLKYPCEYSDAPPYEVISTPWLEKEEILALKNCEDALERLYNSGRFLLSLEYLIKEVGISPFDLFFEFGNSVIGEKMKLWDYAEKFYLHFADKCDKERLRETVLADLISSSTSLQIPNVLKRPDPLYKKLKGYFLKKIGKNAKFVIFYTTNQVYVLDQNQPKNLFGRFSGKIYNINEIEI